jgi:hypothetical protein
MSDELTIAGVAYTSSKRAAQISGYAQDYIGQLCRAGLIDARRIGGLWYIYLDSLYKHKQKADSYVPVLPRKVQSAAEPDVPIIFEGKDYIPASRAAEITGYHKDYVGQLARKGSVLSRQVGSRWYVEKDGLIAHKAEKDRLLAMVQAEAVGLKHKHIPVAAPHGSDREPFFSYTNDARELLPVMQQVGRVENIPISVIRDTKLSDIRPRATTPQTQLQMRKMTKKAPKKTSGKTIFYATSSAMVLTIVIMLSFGYGSLTGSSTYALRDQLFDGPAAQRFAAGAMVAWDRIGSTLERYLTREISYKRPPATDF